jgi:hypothetical protein
VALAPSGAFAETATSSVQNSSSPTAVVNQQTGGGVNLNQQYNNQWDNHNGFAPGVYCRTPTFYLGAGNGNANSWGPESSVGTNLTQISAGVLVPFRSSVLADCARMAKALTDRATVANQVALVRVCHDLAKDGIKIDPVKFPALSKCVE